MTSLPAPAQITSLPLPPRSTSLPAVPLMVHFGCGPAWAAPGTTASTLTTASWATRSAVLRRASRALMLPPLVGTARHHEDRCGHSPAGTGPRREEASLNPPRTRHLRPGARAFDSFVQLSAEARTRRGTPDGVAVREDV